MNTGHEGSMTTTHANSPREALTRMETLCLMGGIELPARAIREQIAASIHLIVQQDRFPDGTRRVTSISEVCGLEEHGELKIQEIFRFRQRGLDEKSRVMGDFEATGFLPSFLDSFVIQGLVNDGEYL